MAGKNPFETRDVRGRRGGPAKEPLTRERVVSEALRQLKQDGLEGMSLRKVAQALDTGAASLYVYVHDLDALRALVLDRALADVDVSGGKHRAWREKVKAILTSYGDVLFGTRDLAKLALGTSAFGPNTLRILDALLGFLHEGGIEPAVAAWSVDLLLLYVTAIAAEHGDSSDPGDTRGASGPLVEALARAPRETYPHLHAVRDALLSGEGDTRFAWAVDVLLNGIVGARVPKAETKKRGKRTLAK